MTGLQAALLLGAILVSCCWAQCVACIAWGEAHPRPVDSVHAPHLDLNRPARGQQTGQGVGHVRHAACKRDDWRRRTWRAPRQHQLVGGSQRDEAPGSEKLEKMPALRRELVASTARQSTVGGRARAQTFVMQDRHSARASSTKEYPTVDRAVADLLSSEWSRDKATSLVSRQLDREKKLPVACTTGPYDCAAGFDNTPA